MYILDTDQLGEYQKGTAPHSQRLIQRLDAASDPVATTIITVESLFMAPDESESIRKPAQFATTHWSVVLAAGEGASANSARALESLCQLYWYPLYVFVRKRGYDVHEAQDLIQEFLCRLLERGGLQQANPRKGRFRSFLLASLKNFLANRWDHNHAKKRGGGQAPVSLNWESAEGRFAAEPSDDQTPERLFDRRWGLTVLDATFERLAQEAANSGKKKQWEQLKGFLIGAAGADHVTCHEAAQDLGMTEGAVKTAIHRWRKRYGELLREEISHTVDRRQDIAEEIRDLFKAVGA